MKKRLIGLMLAAAMALALAACGKDTDDPGSDGGAKIILHAVLGKFSLNVLVGTACTVAIRVTALDHKSGYDPVEGQAVIEPFPRQLQGRDRICIRNFA